MHNANYANATACLHLGGARCTFMLRSVLIRLCHCIAMHKCYSVVLSELQLSHSISLSVCESEHWAILLARCCTCTINRMDGSDYNSANVYILLFLCFGCHSFNILANWIDGTSRQRRRWRVCSTAQTKRKIMTPINRQKWNNIPSLVVWIEQRTKQQQQ